MKFFMPLHTDILSKETSDFLKQLTFLWSYNSVFIVGGGTRFEIFHPLVHTVKSKKWLPVNLMTETLRV